MKQDFPEKLTVV